MAGRGEAHGKTPVRVLVRAHPCPPALPEGWDPLQDPVGRELSTPHSWAHWLAWAHSLHLDSGGICSKHHGREQLWDLRMDAEIWRV